MTIELTDTIITEMLECFNLCLPINATCDYVGISERTFHYWKKKAEIFSQSVENGVEPKEEDEKYYQLFRKIKRQLAVSQRGLLKDIKSDSAWQAKYKVLSRYWYKDWGDKQIVETSDLDLEEKLQAGSNIDISKLDNEEIEQLNNLMEKASNDELGGADGKDN